MVMASSLPAHFRILLKLASFMPAWRAWGQGSKHMRLLSAGCLNAGVGGRHRAAEHAALPAPRRTHADVAIAAVVLEAVCPQRERHQADMAGVHRLQAEAAVVAVEVGILDQVLDRLHHLRRGRRPASFETTSSGRQWAAIGGAACCQRHV